MLETPAVSDIRATQPQPSGWVAGAAIRQPPFQHISDWTVRLGGAELHPDAQPGDGRTRGETPRPRHGKALEHVAPVLWRAPPSACCRDLVPTNCRDYIPTICLERAHILGLNFEPKVEPKDVLT